MNQVSSGRILVPDMLDRQASLYGIGEPSGKVKCPWLSSCQHKQAQHHDCIKDGLTKCLRGVTKHLVWVRHPDPGMRPLMSSQ